MFVDIPLLKDCFPLWMVNGSVELRNNKDTVRLTLDPRLGLVVQAKKGVEQ
jgi:hypothetical protein